MFLIYFWPWIAQLICSLVTRGAGDMRLVWIILNNFAAGSWTRRGGECLHQCSDGICSGGWIHSRPLFTRSGEILHWVLPILWWSLHRRGSLADWRKCSGHLCQDDSALVHGARGQCTSGKMSTTQFKDSISNYLLLKVPRSFFLTVVVHLPANNPKSFNAAIFPNLWNFVRFLFSSYF